MIELLQERLKAYGAATALEEENATKQILQEVVLYALWRADFFEVTCIVPFSNGVLSYTRIQHRYLDRSELCDNDYTLASARQRRRRDIQNSEERLSKLSKRYGINSKTVARWRSRKGEGVADRKMGSKSARSG